MLKLIIREGKPDCYNKYSLLTVVLAMFSPPTNLGRGMVAIAIIARFEYVKLFSLAGEGSHSRFLFWKEKLRHDEIMHATVFLKQFIFIYGFF